MHRITPSLAVLVAALVVAALVIAMRVNDRELNVYVALLGYYRPLPQLKDVAFVSWPNDFCNDGDLRRANEHAAPRDIDGLSSEANILSYAATRTAFASRKIRLSDLSRGKRLILLSRVAFSQNGDIAKVCVTGGDVPDVVLLDRNGLFSWKVRNE